MFRDALLEIAKMMADCRILKANYNAKLQKYFIVAVDRTTKIQKTWAIPACDVWPSQKTGEAVQNSEIPAGDNGSSEKSSDTTSELKECELVQSGE